MAVLLIATVVLGSDLDGLLVKLGDKQFNVASRAYYQLRKRLDAELMRELLERVSSFSRNGQKFATDLIESYDAKQATRAYRRLSDSSSAYLQLSAGLWLVKHGKAKDGLPLISRALANRPESSVDYAYLPRKLSKYPHPGVEAALAAQVSAGEESWRIRYVLKALHDLNSQVATKRARGLFQNGSPDVVAMSAAYVLAAGGKDAVGVLTAASRNPKLTSVGMFAVSDMLASMGALPDPLLEALKDRAALAADTYGTASWLRLLVKLRHRPVISVLRKFLKSEDAYLAKQSLSLLDQFAGSVSEKMLVDALRSESAAQRIWAADLLRRRDDYRGLSVVVAALSSKSWADRSAAATALGDMRRAEVVAPLLRAMDDENSSVRRVAARSLRYVIDALFPYRSFQASPRWFDADANGDARKARIAAIRAWWQKNKDADW